jgi:hypothetical protein
VKLLEHRGAHQLGLVREQRAAVLLVAVQEYIADVRAVFGERTA